MASIADRRRLRAWITAARPQTLPAAAAPVVVGAGVGLHQGVFAALPVVVAAIGAGLIQVGTNFANDYSDAVRGADAPDREGFTRATASGLLEPQAVRRGAAITFALAILAGTYLVAIGGLPIVVVGLSSIAAGVAYTGGPWPFGYHGFGDVFVFLYFGVVAVMGTYYVQVASAGALFPLTPPPGAVSVDAFVASVPIGAIATAILVVNNLRDLEADAAAGKRTLAVILGVRATRVEYLGLLALAYLVPCSLWIGGGYGPAVLAPIATLPLAVFVAWTVLTETSGEALNPALERTGQLLLAYAVLFAGGLAV